MATVSSTVPVPGLHCSLTVDQLRESTKVYNSLPDDHEQPSIAAFHLRNLAIIFLRHNAQGKVGLHLIHGHLHLLINKIMLGHTIDKPHGCWTKPVSVDDINPESIHGHIFKICSGDRWVAYEYRDGPLPNLDGMDPAFFGEVLEYLKAAELTNVLGLQVLSGASSTDLVEIVLQDAGTVMLDADSVKVGDLVRTTGWLVGEVGGIATFKGGESHAKPTKGTHQVFVDGKPLPTLDALRAVLYEEGIIF